MQKQTAPSAPAKNSGTRKTVTWSVVVVIVLALAGWGLVALHNKNTEGAPADSTSGTIGSTNALTSDASSNTPTNTSSASNASLVIPSPQKAGDTVAVQSIDVSVPTWVVVYEERNGKPGNALGAAWFAPSVHSGTVELLRATVPGGSYIVGESRDNGDKVFSLTSDPAVRDAQGNPLWVPLQTQ